jgi:hypothetical protein
MPLSNPGGARRGTRSIQFSEPVFSAYHFVIADITRAFVDASRCFDKCAGASRWKDGMSFSRRLRTRPRHTLVSVKGGLCECGSGLGAKCDDAERQHGEDENRTS